MSLPLHTSFKKTCKVTSNSSGCPGPNKNDVCKAIRMNTIYDNGNYDCISMFSMSPQLGGFELACSGPGKYAQCMTAACYKEPASDGSPVECYCHVFDTHFSFMVGSPWNGNIPCAQPYPYLLSAVASTLKYH